jgi:hypothetical protein
MMRRPSLAILAGLAVIGGAARAHESSSPLPTRHFLLRRHLSPAGTSEVAALCDAESACLIVRSSGGEVLRKLAIPRAELEPWLKPLQRLKGSSKLRRRAPGGPLLEWDYAWDAQVLQGAVSAEKPARDATVEAVLAVESNLKDLLQTAGSAP